MAQKKKAPRRKRGALKKRQRSRKLARAAKLRQARKLFKKRSEAAKRGWVTRRENIARKQRLEARGIPEDSPYLWQRWTYEHRINVTATLLYKNPDELVGRKGERRIREDARLLMLVMRQRFPDARLYGGTILYKRSTDGKVWDKGIITKYHDWKPNFDDASELLVEGAAAFYNDLTNPNKFQHAYKVKIVGLASRAMLRRSEKLAEEGEFETIKGIVTLSRKERNLRRL